MTKGVAAGVYGMPYRWRPLTWEYEGTEYFNERPISTPQTGFSFVSQSRSFMPKEVAGVLWFGVDDTYMTVYTPMYASMTKIPYNFAQGRASLSKFSWDAAFWIFNFVSNYVYPRYSVMVGDVVSLRNKLEGQYFAQQKDIEEKALQILKTSRRDAVEYLNNYSVEMADITIKNWKALGENLMVKYMDGISKDENHHPQNIGYPDDFKKQIVLIDGEKVKMKKIPGEDETKFSNFLRTGESFLKEKNYQLAKESFEKALEIKPQDEEIKTKIAKLDEMLKKIDEIYESNF